MSKGAITNLSGIPVLATGQRRSDLAPQSISIINARLLDPLHQLDTITPLHVSGGKIIGLGSAPSGFSPAHTIDAQGHIVCPSFTDLNARCGQPGFEHKGSIATETRAAVRSGITTIICPPDTKPVIDSSAVARIIQENAEQKGACKVLPLGALTQNLACEKLSEMHALQAAGCIGFSNAGKDIRNTRTLLRCLEYAATLNLPVFFNAEDSDLAADGCVHMGATATRLGLAGIPASAEITAVARALVLTEQTEVKAHFNQITTGRSVELIADAQNRGLPVTADVSIKHLLLSDSTIDGFNSLYHLRPPLRSEIDRKCLIEGVSKGIITAICSAHSPQEAAAKRLPFPETAPGISMLDSFLPCCLELLNHQLDLNTILNCLTHGPMKIIGADSSISQGISTGAVANLVLLDPKVKWELSAQDLLSKGLNNADLGRTLTGAVRMTMIDGAAVYRR